MANQPRRWLFFLQGSSAGRGLFSIVGGTTLGQLATIAATPLLTRLYDAGEMGVYAVYAALVGIFVTSSSLHYELAIPLPRTGRAASLLLKLALLCLVGVSLLMALLLMLFGEVLLRKLGTPELAPYAGLIALGLFLWGAGNALSGWATRNRLFSLSGAAKGSQGVIQSVGQVLFGFAQAGVIGLIIGQLLGALSSIAILVRSVKFRQLAGTSKYQCRRLWATAREYRRFPLFTSWSSLANSLSAYLPPVLLALWFGTEVAGFFALGFRIVQLPFRLIGQATLQVFFASAAQAHRRGEISHLVEQTLQRLLCFGLPTFTALALVAPDLFAVAFGSQWRTAGIYAQLLTAWTFMSFVTTTLSALISVLQQQSRELLFQALYLMVAVGALATGSVHGNAIFALALLSAACSVLLAVKLIWLLRLAKADARRCRKVCSQEVLYTAAMAGLILMAKQVVTGEWHLLLATTAILLATHGFNLWVRNSYDLITR